MTSASRALLTTSSLARSVATRSWRVQMRRSALSASSSSSAQTDGKLAAINRSTSWSELFTLPWPGRCASGRPSEPLREKATGYSRVEPEKISALPDLAPTLLVHFNPIFVGGFLDPPPSRVALAVADAFDL